MHSSIWPREGYGNLLGRSLDIEVVFKLGLLGHFLVAQVALERQQQAWAHMGDITREVRVTGVVGGKQKGSASVLDVPGL